jgi:streptogramin lyase
LTSGGSGPAGDATHWIVTRVAYPDDVAVGPGGAVYFTDRGANTVRRLSAG